MKTKAEILKKLNTTPVDEAVLLLQQKIQEVHDVIETAKTVIEEAQNIQPTPGEDGVSPDINDIRDAVLKKIDVPKVNVEKIIQAVIAQIPSSPEPIDEKVLIQKILKSLPENKASLKIIQEKIETDPMSVIDKIMALPEGKFKLKTRHIDGLEQTISAFRNQLSRGYLHGGGGSSSGSGLFLGVFATAPLSPVDGSTYINSSNNGYYVAYQGTWNLIITLAGQSFLLLEDGFDLLLEDGGKMILQ